MEKINVAEILKDCPRGLELDCVLSDSVELDGIDMDCEYPIRILIGGKCVQYLTAEGYLSSVAYGGKCVIFPKGKTTWEGFQRPFKDGEIVTTDLGSVFIVKSCLEDEIHYHSYVGVTCCNELQEKQIPFAYKHVCHLATEEEKEKLFRAIKDNGYKWNPETKTLGKLIEPEFKVGDKIKRKGDTRITTINEIRDNCYIIITPDLFDNAYITDKLLFSNQNEYELVPDKFDINTLKPFDKVLVRHTNNGCWRGQFYMAYNKNDDYPFECTYNSWRQCIPYEGNEHLRGTTDDCDEFYKTWKN